MHIEFVAHANSSPRLDFLSAIGKRESSSHICSAWANCRRYSSCQKGMTTRLIGLSRVHNAWQGQAGERRFNISLDSQHSEAQHNISSATDPGLALLWVGSQPLWQLRSRHHEKSASLSRKHQGRVFFFFYIAHKYS